MILLLGACNFILPETWSQAIQPALGIFFVWAVIGFFLSFSIRPIDCPKCGCKFHCKKYGDGFFSPYTYNDLTQKCMHCGLKLNGSNI